MIGLLVALHLARMATANCTRYAPSLTCSCFFDLWVLEPLREAAERWLDQIVHAASVRVINRWSQLQSSSSLWHKCMQQHSMLHVWSSSTQMTSGRFAGVWQELSCAECLGRAIMRSVVMSVVPKRHRGKVNALESVRILSWSGSAALGG